MNFEHLDLVLQIAECNSLSGAARKLFVSQPTVSKMLKAIEDELGFTIFVRSKNGIKPTMSGRMFLEYARDTLDRLRTLKANCSSNIEKGEHMLRTVTNGSDFMKETFLQTVMSDSSRTDVFQYSVANFTDCYSAVLSSLYELAVIFVPDIFEEAVVKYLEASELVSRVLGYLPINIAVSQNSPLAGLGTALSAQDLAMYRISFPHEENSFFSNILQSSAKCFGCTKESYSPRLYGDEEYLRMSASSFVPDPFGMQMYAYSDWVRNIYNPDEFRFLPDSSGPMAKLGKECDRYPNVRVMSIQDAPFRLSVIEMHKSTHSLTVMENEYISRLFILLNGDAR